MKQKKSPSILTKFILLNLLVLSILGLFTIFYLKAVQPNLVKKRTINHITIINNTSDHLERLNINFDKESIKIFLLSTRFLFQSLDRVQFYNDEGSIIGDTNVIISIFLLLIFVLVLILLLSKNLLIFFLLGV